MKIVTIPSDEKKTTWTFSLFENGGMMRVEEGVDEYADLVVKFEYDEVIFGTESERRVFFRDEIIVPYLKEQGVLYVDNCDLQWIKR